MRENWQVLLFGVPRLSPEQLRRRHWEMLAIAVCVVIGCLCFDVQGQERVGLRGIPAAVLPELCGSKAILGVPCPGCGLTRSFLYLAQGRLRDSWEMHRLGGLLAALVVLQIPYRIHALCRPQRNLLPRWLSRSIVSGLIVGLIANWICRLAGL